MAEEAPMEGKQLVDSTAEHNVALPSAMGAWERVGRNTAIGGVYCGVAAMQCNRRWFYVFLFSPALGPYRQHQQLLPAC